MLGELRRRWLMALMALLASAALAGPAVALADPELDVGANHPVTARSLDDLAELAVRTGKPAEAKELASRAAAIRRGALGKEHSLVARSLRLVAGLARIVGRGCRGGAEGDRAVDEPAARDRGQAQREERRVSIRAAGDHH